MKIFRHWMLVPVAASAFAVQATAQFQSPTSLINAGLDAYKAKGPDEAMKVWIKASPIDGSKDALNQANNLRQIESYYGAYQSAEIIHTRDVTKDVTVVYLVLKYATGPVFGRFTTYRASAGWILTNFKFNVDETAVFGDMK